MAQSSVCSITAHFGLITFRFAYGGTQKPSFLFAGFSDVSLSSQTKYFYLWRPQDTYK